MVRIGCRARDMGAIVARSISEAVADEARQCCDFRRTFAVDVLNAARKPTSTCRGLAGHGRRGLREIRSRGRLIVRSRPADAAPGRMREICSPLYSRSDKRATLTQHVPRSRGQYSLWAPRSACRSPWCRRPRALVGGSGAAPCMLGLPTERATIVARPPIDGHETNYSRIASSGTL
jgi:hypothetical protein